MEDVIIKTILKKKVYKNEKKIKKEHDDLFIHYITFNNKEFFKKSELHLFTCLVIPNCLQNRILDCCNIVTLFFIIDDLYDENISDQELISEFISILDNKTINYDNQYVKMFYKIWNNIKYKSNINSLYQFSNSIKEWFYNVNLKNKDLNRQSYLSFRRINSGFFFTLSVLRYGMDINLDESILNNDYIKKVQNVVGDHAMLVNDLYSYEKECIKNTSNYYHPNMITILKNTESLDTKKAIKEIIDIILNREKQFRELIDKNPYKNEEIYKYINSLEYVMSGNHYWSTVTGRYNF